MQHALANMRMPSSSSITRMVAALHRFHRQDALRERIDAAMNSVGHDYLSPCITDAFRVATTTIIPFTATIVAIASALRCRPERLGRIDGRLVAPTLSAHMAPGLAATLAIAVGLTARGSRR
jgi:hypothetical protein